MKDLILLHGALGSSESLTPLKELLRDEYRCHTLDFSGHGGQSFNPEGFGIEFFADELAEFIKAKQLNKPNIFGYSMGGYVALYLANQQPNMLGKICTLGTKFGWSPEAAEKETSRMNPEVMEEKIPAYTAKLAAAHGDPWKELVWQTAGMMLELGGAPLLTTETLSIVQNEVLIMRGSEDEMVNDVESKWAVAHLTNGEFKSIANQPHPIEKVNLLELKNSVGNFLYD